MTKIRLRNRIVVITATLAVFVLDRWTKLLVESRLALGESYEVLGKVLQFTHITNSNGVMGISFGPFSRYLMLPLSLLAITAIVYFYLRSQSRSLLSALATGFILGGAAGNMLDRFRTGVVTDFIDCDMPDIIIHPFKAGILKFPGFYLDRWYTFNIADSAVLIGVTLLIFFTIKEEYRANHDPGTKK
ncbi:signal peptidase II [candidate division TA06 bacterium]|uniref:Lipoprotein signal peptidase n=1 Tax=candidate division TA06 bacterium TaxID=2250710 RepID=A0A933IA18_UNCT6|nr:signal peptidase II [candidate division TA06 bacterium]